MKHDFWAAAMTVATCVVIAGCQQGGGRSSRDMSEWETPEQPTRSVAATTDQPQVEERTVTRTVNAAPADASLYSLVGRRCRVQFRRDALGMAVTAPLPPNSEGVGGRPAHLDGTVTAVSESWITLTREGVTYNIPHAAILLIETRAE
jgi:hypothetical protein